MSKLRFALLAQQDLQEIFDYIAEDNPVTAERFIQKVEARCRSLVAMPNIGRTRDDLAPGLRSIVEGNYLIFYRGINTENSIYIVRIFHAKRDIDDILLPED